MKTGSSMKTPMKLRQWQEEALLDARSRNEHLTMWEAPPGAGKTIPNILLATEYLRGGLSKVAFLVPTVHLKQQWSETAKKLTGLKVQADYKMGNRIRHGHDGVALTYQQLSTNPEGYKKLLNGAIICMDEIHHAGTDTEWGQAISFVCESAGRIISNSGTPFRTDGSKIPHVPYDASNYVQPHYRLEYRTAIEQGIIRPLTFFTYSGSFQWNEPIAGEIRVTFADDLYLADRSKRLNTALLASGDLVRGMVVDADRLLTDLRKHDSPDAGALLLASTQQHAEECAERIKELTGCTAVIVTAETPQSSRVLDDFRNGRQRWLVSVKKVSEGIDVPRLRVLVMATNVTTEMFFRQAGGRVTRNTTAGMGSRLSPAYCFLPGDPRFVQLARNVEIEQGHQAEDSYGLFEKKKPEPEDEFLEMVAESDEEEKERWASIAAGDVLLEEMFASGVVHQLSLLPGELSIPMLTIQQQKRKVTAVTPTTAHQKFYGDDLESLRKTIRRLVEVVTKKHGIGHRDVYARLKAMQGGLSQTECDERLLRDRIEIIRREWRIS